MPALCHGPRRPVHRRTDAGCGPKPFYRLIDWNACLPFPILVLLRAVAMRSSSSWYWEGADDRVEGHQFRGAFPAWENDRTGGWRPPCSSRR